MAIYSRIFVCFCMFDLMLYVPVDSFVVISWVVLRSTMQLIKCHAQGHNTITAGG